MERAGQRRRGNGEDREGVEGFLWGSGGQKKEEKRGVDG